MKINEIRETSTVDLIQKEKGFKKELFDLNYQKKIGQVEKPRRFRELKRDIAKILTIIKEREIDERSK